VIRIPRKMTIEQLNRLSEADASLAFKQCCGADEWVDHMVHARPYDSLEEIVETSDNAWEGCDVDVYEEASRSLPRLGDADELAGLRAAGQGLDQLGRRWAALELKGMEGSSPGLMAQLAEAHAAYEENFGHRFVVNATGKSGEELLALMQARLKNDPEDEIMIAAEEQNKITKLRLKKLLA
ncbi:MAG TPA: 2-oxo-4-hydroxy-4-carboxy-5-ureidoimidazoline decarboxylase, partial [Flavobacteriales bacterium]|nr:2-oxo-4-hydroxy-4-carboxy-5-ureidoimidazoline decarboxylase [Flavobacteriales bacterium]